MFNETHDLASDFPEYKERIHQLKESNAHFRRLCDDYHVLDKEVHRIEQQIDTPSDEYTEEVKKKRAALKDELYAMLKAADAA